jgi:hypothetical protein
MSDMFVFADGSRKTLGIMESFELRKVSVRTRELSARVASTETVLQQKSSQQCIYAITNMFYATPKLQQNAMGDQFSL